MLDRAEINDRLYRGLLHTRERGNRPGCSDPEEIGRFDWRARMGGADRLALGSGRESCNERKEDYMIVARSKPSSDHGVRLVESKPAVSRERRANKKTGSCRERESFGSPMSRF